MRLLVSSAILEEGIDVPACDAVIDFDGAQTSRGWQQRKGRARASNAYFAYTLDCSDEETRLLGDQRVQRLQEWQNLAVRQLSGADRPPPPTPSAAECAARISERVVRPLRPDGDEVHDGAMLPIERCKQKLQRVYCETMFVLRPGDTPFEVDFTADGSHFTAKEKKGGNFVYSKVDGGFCCQLELPQVLLCSKPTDGSDGSEATLP